MKKIISIILCILLCVGVAGGTFALARHIDSYGTEEPVDSSIVPDDTQTPPNDDSNKTPSNGDSNSSTEEDNGNSSVEEDTSVEGVWMRCTDVTELSVGDKIIIKAQDEDFALSNVQNANNRGVATATVNGDFLTASSDVQIIVLQEGVVENTFAFWVGTGYLYSPSTSSNYMKTRTDINENASWKIEIDEIGQTNIYSCGENTHNTIQYNKRSDLFSCYEAGSTSQMPVLIYKLIDGENNE